MSRLNASECNLLSSVHTFEFETYKSQAISVRRIVSARNHELITLGIEHKRLGKDICNSTFSDPCILILIKTLLFILPEKTTRGHI